VDPGETPPEETAAPAPPPTATPTPASTDEAPSPEPAEDAPSVADVWVVYPSEGQLWLVEGMGEPVALTEGALDSAPEFSPDGEWIFFWREMVDGEVEFPPAELWVVRADGSDARRLVTPEDLPGEMAVPAGSDTEELLARVPLQVTWVPGREALAFNTHIAGSYGLATKDDLWIVDLETGEITQLLAEGEGGTFAFSPDGEMLVVSDPTSVSMMTADGTDRRTLVTFDFVNTASEYAYYPVPVWAPDSSHALVGISSPEPFGPDPSGTLWRLPRTGEAVRLGTIPGEVLFATMDDTLWSPDRSRIAYTTRRGETLPTRELVIAAADGSDPLVYVTGDVQFLNWAPDSRHFTFWQNRPTEVYLGQRGEESGRLVPEEEAPRVDAVRWVDGRRFVYLVGGEGENLLRLGTFEGDHTTIATLRESFPLFDIHTASAE
jgi:dipeptidyl aminopeptidase/acylaminoacyl peptidase